MTLFRLTAPSVFAASVALLATGCFTDRPSDTPEADCEDTTSACDDNCTEADDADCDDDGSSADPDCENTSDECDDGCTEADADIDPDCAPAPDTGTAYLFTHGSIASDGTKVDATYGYMAKNLANDEWVCEMSATYSGSGDA
ncbi:MAG: hypothetical protein EXR71_18910, partial [Myxococcales bacterium]|nr:hypothetical protein [Myxococcales bacterium]